jgi:hypothetical protein
MKGGSLFAVLPRANLRAVMVNAMLNSASLRGPAFLNAALKLARVF